MNQYQLLRDIREVLMYYSAIGIERIPQTLYKSMEEVMYSIEGLNPSGDTDGQKKEKLLKSLREEIGECTRCRLSERRTNIVFGEGNPDAGLMFVGEAPGEEEDIQGRPFVGRAGELLTRLITKMGFKREDVYIANVVKCRPPGNRKPLQDEIETCIPFLRKQIEVISPKVIIALGDVATRALIPDAKNISRMRGRSYRQGKIHVVPTFHPSYLLRNPSHKILTWNDAQIALKLLKEV